MSIKQNILYSLNQSRRMMDGLVDSLANQDDWMYQAHPKANHPLWIVGHIGLADNSFLSRLAPEKDNQPEGWTELFWFGSEVSPDSAKYPPPEEVVAYFRERRKELLKAIEGLNDDFLLSPTPEEGMFSDAPNMAQMLFFIAYHEGVHTGQLTVAHRGLGHDPLFKPTPEVTA